MLNKTDILSAFLDYLKDPSFAFADLLRTLGIVAIIYIIYLITQVVITFKKARKIKVIERRLGAIEEKLDKLVSKKDQVPKTEQTKKKNRGSKK
jgi:hypothetical protein